jgi:transposase InsO family protein
MTGTPEYLRSDNGSEFRARIVREWLVIHGVTTLFIAPGSPCENGYVESFTGKLRDELLNGEIFYTIIEAQVLIGRWRREYNQVRPHSSLGYRPPAPEPIEWPPGDCWKRNARYERIPNIIGGTLIGGRSSYVSRMELQ